MRMTPLHPPFHYIFSKSRWIESPVGHVRRPAMFSLRPPVLPAICNAALAASPPPCHIAGASTSHTYDDEAVPSVPFFVWRTPNRKGVREIKQPQPGPWTQDQDALSYFYYCVYCASTTTCFYCHRFTK